MPGDNSVITLHTDNLDLLVFRPEEVLEDYEGFWETHRVQFLTKEWAKAVNYEIPHDKVIAMIEEWAAIPSVEREKQPLFRITQTLIAGKDALIEKALPHLQGFFPKETDLSVEIHLTAFNPSRAFAKFDIVINVAAPYWKENPENIMNAIVHEIGHVGHSYYRTLWTEARSQPELKHKILDNINSEGICTYIGYTAQHFAPAPDDLDYPLIDYPDRVRTAFKEVNEILSLVGTAPDEEVQQRGWDQGVMGRSYYVVGTHICKQIDSGLGRPALIECMSTGPRAWLERYNQISPAELQLSIGETEMP